MNRLQKEAIRSLRIQGRSYTDIAEELSLSKNTVKSFCQRNQLGSDLTPTTDTVYDSYCRQCGKPIKQIAGKKEKRYCSDDCRMTWWNTHPEEVKHKNIRKFTCQTCGVEFEGYGKRERKYCSRTCYGKSRGVIK